MAPFALETQQDTSRFLSKVESDLQELARCQQRATQEDAARWQDVQAVIARLQQHREQIRQRSSAKNSDKATQSKLAAARAKIEEGVRKARELERRRKADSPQQPSSPAMSATSSPGSAVPSSTLDSTRSASVDLIAETFPESEAAKVEEVKVLAEQLIADASAEGGDVTSEFVCKICQTHVVGCQPKLTTCSHLFCGDCISKWFAVQPSCQSWAGRAKGAGSVPCPVCKEPLRADKDLHTVCSGGKGGSAFLWQMLSSTRIICANHSKCRKGGRCDWEGDYGSYQEHIRHCSNEPCHALAPACPAPLASSAEVAEASAVETFASDADITDVQGHAVAKTFSDTSCTASSFGDCDATASETESEPAEGSKAELVLEDVGSPEISSAVPVVAGSAEASGPDADLCSLIAQLVELKATAVPMQLEQQPEQQLASYPAAVPPSQPTLQSKNSGNSKQGAKPKHAQPKRSQESLAAAQCQAQATELRALQAQAQAQAKMTQAAQAVYAAQWQAAWQMQAVRTMQWQQASMAYAGQVAQWHSAQKQAAQAARARQTARR
jgi:hypothetical protein